MSAAVVTRGGEKVRLPDVRDEDVDRTHDDLVRIAAEAYGLSIKKARALVATWMIPMSETRRILRDTVRRADRYRTRARWIAAHMDEFLARAGCGPMPIDWRHISWKEKAAA